MDYALCNPAFPETQSGRRCGLRTPQRAEEEAYKSNPDIDMERSKNNYHLVAPPKYTYKKEINRKVAEAGCRTRKDSVMMVETLITASPEFMNQLPPEEQKAYFTMALDFISERVGSRISSPQSSTWTRERPICTSALCRLHQTISCPPKQF